MAKAQHLVSCNASRAKGLKPTCCAHTHTKPEWYFSSSSLSPFLCVRMQREEDEAEGAVSIEELAYRISRACLPGKPGSLVGQQETLGYACLS